MSIKRYSFIVVILILAFTACKKNSPAPVKTKPDTSTTKTDTTKKDTSKTDTTKKGNAEPGLYIVGTSDGNATYWLNGQPVHLSPGGANAIAISNGYVYVAGYSLNSSGFPVATYWKNGVAVKLADSLSQSFISSICVVGTDVYAVGFSLYPNGRSLYWKNGVVTQIASSDAITVNNGNVYISGSTYNVPTYWENGKATSLDYHHMASGEAVTIAIDGTDIYLSGFIADKYQKTPSSPYSDVASYWKNGVLTFLEDTLNFSFIYASAIKNHTAIFAGFTTVSNGNQVAAYWENNTETLLADASVYSQADAITTYEDDVYISGSYGGGPVYWKNGAMTKLNGGGFTGGIAYLPQK